MVICHRLGRRETGATHADSEWMGGATILTSSSQCLLGEASSRTRGDGLGGRINVEDKSCIGISLFRPGVIINAAHIYIGIDYSNITELFTLKQGHTDVN